MKLNVNFSSLISMGCLFAMLGCGGGSSTAEEAEFLPIDTSKYAINYYDSGNFKNDSARAKKLVMNSISGALNKSNRLSESVQKEYSIFFTFDDVSLNGVTPVNAKTDGLINEIFNSTGTKCLTGADKIRKFAENKVPEGLALHSQDAEMLYYEKLPGMMVLSTFKVRRTNGGEEHYTLPSARVGVSSILDLINPNDANSYIYQMDCSGYLTFALTFAAGKARVAELQAAGNSSTNAKKSAIVAYGMFTSPLAIAMKGGDAFNLAFDDATRKQVLKNIQANPSVSIKDTDVIIVNNYCYLLITSTAGSSSFTGKFDASAGVHILKADFSTTAGGAVSRSVSFTQYDTYVSTRLDNSAENETSMTGAELRAAIAAIP